MNKKLDITKNIIFFVILCLYTCFIPITYGIFVKSQINEYDYKNHYYVSTYEIHYLDGPVDTIYVSGAYSNKETVNCDKNIYYFCNVQGVCRVKLLDYYKIIPNANTDLYNLDVKFKYNK